MTVSIAPPLTTFSYGVIEGFFGRPWSWQARQDYAQFLKQHHFQFYIYAPKGDPYLRRRWREPWPASIYPHLEALAQTYRDTGVAWGIGFTPFEIHHHYSPEVLQQLKTKVEYLNQLQLDILAILFDDMQGDRADMATIQVDVTHRIREWSTAQAFVMCPTYYADTPVLDQIFGDRPLHYLETLGQQLDPSIHIFWTGPDICSAAYPQSHLADVAQRLGRKPFIWDNYPVNDSARMSPFLHLRAFENRPHQLATWTAGLAANPMNQAYLSQIPLLTLPRAAQQQDLYDPMVAFERAAQALGGPTFAQYLREDLPYFQDLGLTQLSADQNAQLIERYQPFKTPYSQEIIDWLNGAYPFSPECLTQ